MRLCMTLLAFVLSLLLQGPAQTPTAGPVVGSIACQSCHSKEYNRWKDSIHGRMIQRANKTTVVSNVEKPGGPASSKAWRDGALYISERGRENRIDYTLGNRRIQHYLSTMPNGEIHVMRTTWDVKRQEWFDSKDIVQNAPEGFIQQWNTTCFYCHVTQQVQDVKGFDPQTFEYKTAWVESSATCERCHGPMADHVNAGAYTPRPASSLFDNLVTCGQCHWPKTVVASGFNTRKPYFDHYVPAFMHLEQDAQDPNWWADGRPRRFSNEAAAFFLSGCFQSGQATCMSCHDPHWNRTDGNDELMKNADQYCAKCHDGMKSAAHTHHAAESAGSSCVGCHMPFEVQGVKATMRDHSLSFPEPENTERYGIPNACGDCHADKTTNWASEYVERWYPGRSSRPRMRATAFAMAQKNDARAVNSLARLATDRKENAAMRATAIGFLGRFESPLALQMLIAAAKDGDPMIRVEAARSLAGHPGETAAVALVRLLSDRYLAVRVQAAGALTSPLFPSMTFTPATQKAFDNAVAELRAGLEGEGDHPNVQVRLGDLEAGLGRPGEARDAYRRALKRNPQEPGAYLGLALLSLEAGNREDAISLARRAVEVASNKELYRKLLEKIESRR
jgi:predicted CXXCH cytochrome family protein